MLKRKLSCSLLCSCVLFATNCFAHTYVLSSILHLDYFLPYNNPQEIENPFPWTISATCEVSSEDREDGPYTEFWVHAELLSRTAVINKVPLAQNTQLDLKLHPGENLSIAAAPLAKVSLTNLSEHTLKASCSPG